MSRGLANWQPNQDRHTLLKRNEFDRYLERWIRINGKPEKLLSPVEDAPTPTVPNSEVTAYSFDRAIVCDRSEIAQLLIANNFHFEHNCAILAIDGYPQHIFDTAMEMLRRNRELKVYALHDCSPAGIQILDRLREPRWFPDPNLPIIDVGILPRQIIDSPDFLTIQSAESASLSQQLPSKIRERFNPDELSWLDEGYGLELASLSPRKLIQILQRTISDNRQQQAIEAGDLLFVDNSPGFYTLESFG